MNGLPIFKMVDVNGGYLKTPVIKGISLEINSGDFVGIIGPNGSGKSTLLRIMSRVLDPWSGSIVFDGCRIDSISIKGFCRKVAFVSQDISGYLPFTALEAALMGRIPHLRRLNTETKKDIAIAEGALHLTGALEFKDKRMDELSAGEQQRVIIAKALAQQPALLFLDEPTSHLDIGHQIQVMDLLKKLNGRSGLTIVMVLHDLNLASEYCRNIILLNEGKVFKEGKPEDVLTYQNIESVYNTVVVVRNNPISSKPYVMAVPGDSTCRNK